MANQHLFTTKKLPQMFKHALITLTPKRKHANMIADFHPISLCTNFYKVIAKILVNRLQATLPHIISLTQLAFIKGRNIANNIALA